MNTDNAVQTEESANQYDAPEILEREAIPHASFLESWLLKHLDLLAIAIVAAGFVLRIFAAARSYLNPDEALHYVILNQASAFLAYKASLGNAHPPLIYLVVYYWHFLGQSELMLRLPSVIAGTAFCWLFYKWMGLVFGRAASWIGLILAAFSPSLIHLSAELRGYALLLVCVSGALYFLERAFAEKSVRLMWGFTAFLYLAILSHYSAAFFALATGVYVLARIADSHLPRRAVIAWAIGQTGALAIYAFLYITHLSKIKSSLAMWSTSFGTTYFHQDSINLFTFTWQNTFSIFLFLFGQPPVALVMLLCSVAGMGFLLYKGLLSRPDSSPTNRLGILLIFPFIGVWCAAIAGIYPYIGSRHTVFLAPFAIAAASYILAGATGKKMWAGLLVATLLMVVANTDHWVAPPEEATESQSKALMASAVHYLDQSIQAGDYILSDYQSSPPFRFYFCGPKVFFPTEDFHGGYFDFTCKGKSVVTLPVYKLIPQTFPKEFQKMARAHGLKPGERVWVYQTGWGLDLGTELAGHDAAFRCLAPSKFGERITVTPFVVGPDLMPESSLRGLLSSAAFLPKPNKTISIFPHCLGTLRYTWHPGIRSIIRLGRLGN